MQIGVLGPLVVRDDGGRPVDVAGSRLRCLLTRLALDAGRPVPVTTLVDAVWSDDPPAEAANALQSLASRLRRLLGPSAVVSDGGGYRLAVSDEDVDALRFATLASSGAAQVHAGQYSAAAATLADAVGLWRGTALADALAANDSLLAEAARLDEALLAARVNQVQALLELGDPGTVLQAERLAAEHPLHERVAVVLLRALAADGRQADALTAYDRVRRRLADELGVDPSAELRQAYAELLSGESPVRRAGPTRRTNLRAQLSSFVGREDDVAGIAKALAEHRLVTLVGPGGAGKTRLAVEAAAALPDPAAHGTWLVELAALTAGGDIAVTVLEAVGLQESSTVERRAKLLPRDALSRLVDGLAERECLLVIDNCEHVIEDAARVIEHLLGHCPALRVLATSREALAIVGETVLPVPPLGQPTPDVPLADALRYPAVRLFADRAAAVRPGFVVDDGSVSTVIDVVRRLDGLPLAIELAAARVRTMTLPELALRLDDRFRLLSGGSRTALPRHRTLRAVVQWSWELLSDDERDFAEQLAVFPAGVTATSAAAVTGTDVVDASDLLASLLDKSLLQPVGDAGRARMLETIRQYGLERLAERGRLADVRRAHAQYFARLMAEAEPQLTTAAQVPWFELLQAERDNLIAAVRHLCETGEVGTAVDLGIALGMFALLLGRWGDIGGWLDAVVTLPEADAPPSMTVARALAAISRSAVGGGDGGHRELNRLARELAEVPSDASRWLPLIRPAVAFFADEPGLVDDAFRPGADSPDEWTRAAVRMLHANVAENEGDTATARADTVAALEIFTRLGERWGMANALRGLAEVQMLDGELDAAAESYARARQLSAELHSHEDEGFVQGRLADLELRRGNIEAARAHVERVASTGGSPIEEVFALAMRTGVELAANDLPAARSAQQAAMDRLAQLPQEHPGRGHIRAMTLASAVRLAVIDGDLDQAQRWAREAFPVARATRDMPLIASVSVSLAALQAETGNAERAALMLGAGAALRGAPDDTSFEVARLTDQLRSSLGPARVAELVSRGRALDRAAALDTLDPER